MTELTHLDKRQVRRSFDRAAATYDAAAVLQREIERRMLERLDYMKLVPEAVLDAGCGTGGGSRELERRYPAATVIGLDLALAMLEAGRRQRSVWQRLGIGRSRIIPVCGDVEHLPIRSAGVALAWSNLTLQWCNDLPHALSEMRRALRPGGLLMFSTFGPDTLKELRMAYAAIDGYSHVNRFVDMHDIGDMLVASRFADPVIDMEYFTLTYSTVREVMRDLKAIGAHNVTSGRPRGLMGKSALAAVERAYEPLRRDGKLPATFEVVYGQAWVPEDGNTRAADGRAVVQFHPRRRTS